MAEGRFKGLFNWQAGEYSIIPTGAIDVTGGAGTGLRVFPFFQKNGISAMLKSARDILISDLGLTASDINHGGDLGVGPTLIVATGGDGIGDETVTAHFETVSGQLISFSEPGTYINNILHERSTGSSLEIDFNHLTDFPLVGDII